MKVKTNSLKELKQVFLDALSKNYEIREINTLFYLIAEKILERKKSHLVAFENDIKFSESDYLKFNSYLKRLIKNEPIQYIFGENEFYQRTFNINKYTLVPRPETEELVQIIIRNNHNRRVENILDIGTGSGCIGITLSIELSTQATLIDISSEALKIANQNIQKFDAMSKTIELDILQEDSWKKIEPHQFDIIVSNPPYVTESEKEYMNPNVMDYEPHSALFVKDEDPLLFYRKICMYADKNLSLGGQLYFEINENLGDEMQSLMKNYNFEQIKIIKDLNNKDRFAVAIKK